MAELDPGSGGNGSTQPRTIQVGISGTSATESYTLAPGLAQYVQSVYLEVDNTAGGSARPTLTVSEQSGVVIAKKRQGEAIPAGDTGSATWALRLDDERAATGAAPPLFFATLTMQGPLAGELGSANVTHPADNDPTLTPEMFLGVVWTAKLNGQLEITLYNGSATPITSQLISLFVQRLDVLSRESLGGSQVVIAPGTTESIPIDFQVLGSALLNIGAAPPTFNAAGVYAVFASILIIP